jgi:NAD kinase
MPSGVERKVVLVTRHSRLEELVVRHQTLAQAQFYIEHLGGDFADYRREHEAYAAAKQETIAALGAHGRYQAIDRAFLPNFLFGPDDIVVALGQDGLVANTLKYLDGHPTIGLNPEPARYDGVLLPFRPHELPAVLRDVVVGKRPMKAVSMAEARLSDGQVLDAVNDLFVGPQSHTSARYEIALGERHEVQSSSGLIVATGMGSTAWLKSIVTGAMGVAAAYAADHTAPASSYAPLPWDSEVLQFAVREPFPSRSSQASLICGRIERAEALRLRSLMPEGGVIFSDGIEADRLAFTAGMEAKIALSSRRGQLVV